MAWQLGRPRFYSDHYCSTGMGHLVAWGCNWPEQRWIKNAVYCRGDDPVVVNSLWQGYWVPRRALQSTLLDRCEQVLQTPVSVRNLCKPTLPVYPPTEDRFHWRVMSHLGTGFLNMLSSAEVLRGTLALYNWRDDELNHRRLDAILAVQHHRIQRFEKGFLLRGLDVEVTLDGNGFAGEGDIHLFGEMLNRFLALYADMNQFNQLTLIVQPEGKCIRWKENHNPRLPG